MGVDDVVHDLTPPVPGTSEPEVVAAVRELLDGGDRRRSDPARLLTAVRAGGARRRRRRRVVVTCVSAVVVAAATVTVVTGVRGWLPRSGDASPTSRVSHSASAPPPLRTLTDTQVDAVLPGSTALLLRGSTDPDGCTLCRALPLTQAVSTWGIGPTATPRSPVPLPPEGTITLTEDIRTWQDSATASRYPALLAASTRAFDSAQAGEPYAQFFSVPAGLGRGLVMGRPTTGGGIWGVTVVGVRGTVTVRLEAGVVGLGTRAAGRAATAQVAALAISALDRAAGT